MSNLEQAAAAAIAAWERVHSLANYDTFYQRMDALREALAAHKQAEPVAWVGLTSEDMDELAPYGQYAHDVALLVEDRLWERNAKRAEPVVFTDAAIEAAITAWFGWNNGPTASMMTDVSGFEGRMRAAIKAACDFKEAK